MSDLLLHESVMKSDKSWKLNIPSYGRYPYIREKIHNILMKSIKKLWTLFTFYFLFWGLRYTTSGRMYIFTEFFFWSASFKLATSLWSANIALQSKSMSGSIHSIVWKKKHHYWVYDFKIKTFLFKWNEEMNMKYDPNYAWKWNNAFIVVLQVPVRSSNSFIRRVSIV